MVVIKRGEAWGFKIVGITLQKSTHRERTLSEYKSEFIKYSQQIRKTQVPSPTIRAATWTHQRQIRQM